MFAVLILAQAAKCSGLSPSEVLRFTQAPHLISNATASK